MQQLSAGLVYCEIFCDYLWFCSLSFKFYSRPKDGYMFFLNNFRHLGCLTTASAFQELAPSTLNVDGWTCHIRWGLVLINYSVRFVEVFSFDLGSVKLRRAELLVLTRLLAMGMKKAFWIVHTRKGNGIEAHWTLTGTMIFHLDLGILLGICITIVNICPF